LEQKIIKIKKDGGGEWLRSLQLVQRTTKLKEKSSLLKYETGRVINIYMCMCVCIYIHIHIHTYIQIYKASYPRRLESYESLKSHRQLNSLKLLSKFSHKVSSRLFVTSRLQAKKIKCKNAQRSKQAAERKIKIFCILIPVLRGLHYSRILMTTLRRLYWDGMPGEFYIAPGSSFSVYLGINLHHIANIRSPVSYKVQSVDALKEVSGCST
jgi:hypothetical protein